MSENEEFTTRNNQEHPQTDELTHDEKIYLAKMAKLTKQIFADNRAERKNQMARADRPEEKVNPEPYDEHPSPQQTFTSEHLTPGSEDRAESRTERWARKQAEKSERRGDRRGGHKL